MGRLFTFVLIVLTSIIVLLMSARPALTETSVVDNVTATDRNHRQHRRAGVAAGAGWVNRLPRFALA